VPRWRAFLLPVQLRLLFLELGDIDFCDVGAPAVQQLEEREQLALGELVLDDVLDLVGGEVAPVGEPGDQDGDAQLPRVDAVVDL
jgi:hypothetical protein